jgi:ABC-type branched-subunit amino acid transport system substrate-binding protein
MGVKFRKLNIILLLQIFFSPLILNAEFKVGVITGFTGDWGAYGVANRRGIELAEVGQGISFVYEDDQFQPAKTVAAFHKLVDVDNVAAVIIGDTVTAQAVAPIAKHRKIPLLVWASADNAFKDNHFVLRLWTAAERDFSSLRRAVNSHGFKRVKAFTSAHTYSEAWGEAIESFSPDNTRERFTTEPTSFQVEILKLKKSSIDAVAVCLSSGGNGLFIRQMRQLKISFPIFACNFVESSADIAAAGSSINGVFFTAPKLSDKFTALYRSQFSISDHIFSAAVFYDAAKIIEAALKNNPQESLIERILETKISDTALSDLKIVASEDDYHLDFNFAEFLFVDGVIKEQVNGAK